MDIEAIGRDKDSDESTQPGGVDPVVVGDHDRRAIDGVSGDVVRALHLRLSFLEEWCRGSGYSNSGI